MFEICNKADKMCGHCGIASYDPIKQDFDDDTRQFCGIASGFDTRVLSLPDCWLNMTKSQRATFARKKKQEYMELIIRSNK